MTVIAYPAEFLAAIAAEYVVLDDAKVGEFIDSLPERAGECPAAGAIALQLAVRAATIMDCAGGVADASKRHLELAFVYNGWQRYEDALAEADQVSQDDAARGGMPNRLAQVRIFALQGKGEYEQADDLIQQLARDARERPEPYLDLMVATQAAYRAGDFDQAVTFAELAEELLLDLEDDDRSVATSQIAFWKAASLIGMGQPREAEELIDRDLGSRADEVGVVLVKFQVMRSKWQLKDATALVERAAADNPLPPFEDWIPDDDKIALHFVLAVMYINVGRYPDAEKVLEQIVSLEPYFIPAQAVRRQLMAWQGDWHQAVSDLKELHKQYPHDHQTLFVLAFLQLVWHDYDGAAAVAEDLSHIYRANSAAYELSVAALARGRRLDKAQAVAAEGLERFPHSYGLRVQRGWVRFAQLDFGGAQEDFQSVLDAVPRALHAKTGIAAIAFQRREYQNSLELFKKVAAESVDSGPHANLAWVLTAVGQDDEAKSECDLALKRDMPSASALTCRSVLAFRDGDLGQALRKAKEAVDWDPADLSCKVNLASLLSENGDYEAARRLLEEVLSDDPLFAYAHFELGVLDAKTDSLESAGKRLRRAIEVDDRLSEAYQALGDLDLKAGRLAAAEARLREGLRWAPPGDATLYVTLAQVLRGLGDSTEIDDYYHEALRELRTARQRDPRSSSALFEVGAVRLRLGDMAGARQAFRQMLANDKDDPYAQVMLARISRPAPMESAWLRAWSVVLAVLASAQAAVAWIAFLWGKLSVTGLISLVSLFVALIVVAPLLPRLAKLHLAGLEAEITQVQVGYPTKPQLTTRPAPAFGLAPAAPAISSAIWILP
jgi:tetratricopeptide (TPR) repeat protein